MFHLSEAQEILKKHHGKKVKVIAILEPKIMFPKYSKTTIVTKTPQILK